MRLAIVALLVFWAYLLGRGHEWARQQKVAPEPEPQLPWADPRLWDLVPVDVTSSTGNVYHTFKRVPKVEVIQ